MGILNVTPDSFYDGGRYMTEKNILLRAEKIWREGASFIDIGGYSTRPGADDISIEEELSRVIPAIKAIRSNFPDLIISIDTFRAEVAKQAVAEGAGMINDVSGGNLDNQMFDVLPSLGVPYVLMHMKGTPQTMVSESKYENLLKEITDYFHRKIHQLQLAGIKDIIVDPGFGFAKNIRQNFELLRNLQLLQILEKPLMVGLSRKSMIWKTLHIEPDAALNGTTTLNTIALMKGASILRVHDVAEANQLVTLVGALEEKIG